MARDVPGSYKLAVEDMSFLLRDELRGVRFQLEYAKPELLLRDWGIRSTIIVFGSARVPSPEAAAARRARAATPAEICSPNACCGNRPGTSKPGISPASSPNAAARSRRAIAGATT